MYVYAFRLGSRNYPERMMGPFDSLSDARGKAQHMRNMGHETGRVRKVEVTEYATVLADLRRGVLAKGW
jgi:hypothetical protein